MNDKERFEFVTKEREAISEDLETNVQQQILLNKFLKETLKVAYGENPTYYLNKIKKNFS